MFINHNIAWRTKIAWFPIDSLHRSAGCDMVFNGLVPLQCKNDDFRACVKQFSHELIPSDMQDGQLLRRIQNSRTTKTDTTIPLYFRTPEVLDPTFIDERLNESSGLQKDSSEAEPHGILHLLNIVLKKTSEHLPCYLSECLENLFDSLGASVSTDGDYVTPLFNQMRADSLIPNQYTEQLDDTELKEYIQNTLGKGLLDVKNPKMVSIGDCYTIFG